MMLVSGNKLTANTAAVCRAASQRNTPVEHLRPCVKWTTQTGIRTLAKGTSQTSAAQLVPRRLIAHHAQS